MGEDLSLPGREAIRTPMQWDDGPNAGFSKARPDDLVRPVITRGTFGARRVNVRAQQRDPNSLLRWFENLVHTLREAPGDRRRAGVDRRRPAASVGTGPPLRPPIRVDPVPAQPGGHRRDRRHRPARWRRAGEAPYDLLLDGPYAAPGRRLTGLELRGYGYRWIRLRRSDSG